MRHDRDAPLGAEPDHGRDLIGGLRARHGERGGAELATPVDTIGRYALIARDEPGIALKPMPGRLHLVGGARIAGHEGCRPGSAAAGDEDAVVRPAGAKP